MGYWSCVHELRGKGFIHPLSRLCLWEIWISTKYSAKCDSAVRNRADELQMQEEE